MALSAGTVLLQLLVWAKSPLATMLVMFNALLPASSIATFWGALMVSTA